MLLTVFEKYIFLQSLGWGIANSLWQVALLWLVYRSVTASGKNGSPLFKYHFSLILLFASFAWFVSTIVQNYWASIHTGSQATALNWLNVSQSFTYSLQWLSVAYFIALAVQLMVFAKKLNSLFSLQKNERSKAPVDIRLFTEQTALHIGIKKKVTIWLCEKADVPSVMGFFKPMILLPVSALNNLTTGQAEAVILHELAHIKRNDYLVNFIQCSIEMILFFNPFAKLLGNAVRAERENCCDDWVLNYRYSKHDYASALLMLEQNRLASVEFALAATNGEKNLLNRIKRLFAEEPIVGFNVFQRMKLVTVSMSILLLTFFVLPLAENKKKDIENNLHTTALFASVPDASPVSYNENNQFSIQKDPPKPVKEKKVFIKKQPVSKPAATEEIEINTALINEELLEPQNLQLQNVAVQASVQEQEIVTKIFVQVEEEQSGEKDKKIYVIEVNNENGTPEIKPLILLNKKVKNVSLKEKKINKSVSLKKKITS